MKRREIYQVRIGELVSVVVKGTRRPSFLLPLKESQYSQCNILLEA